MSTPEGNVSFKDILHAIQCLPRLAPQERRVILRELVACCDEGDLQVLQRILGQTSQSGYDLVSALPFEVSHHLLLYLGGMDLVRCRAVCRPWRGIIQDNDALWKAKVREWDPAECSLLKDSMDYQLDLLRNKHLQRNQSQSSGTDAFDDEYPGEVVVMDSILDKIERRPGFLGWKEAVIQELTLKQNWKWGRCVHQLTITLTMDIKPVLLAWPLLILVDNWPRMHKISLDRLKGARYRELPQRDGRNYKMMEVPRGHGSVSCIAWDTTVSAAHRTPPPTEDNAEKEHTSLPLALGGFLRTVRMCDPELGTSITLPNVLHGFALHLAYLRDKIIAITLDGHIVYFPKTQPFLPIRSSRVNTKILQVTTVDFGSRTFGRGEGDDMQHWQEAVCLAHEDGVIVKDEHSHTLCQVQLELGAKLIHIQAIADSTWPYRNELLILYEEPNTRQRLILCVHMEPGFREESSRKLLTPSFSLGRGGDARDSIAMYRDRIGIMSHRNCSSDLGHYCVLRLLDLKEDVAVSTEHTQYASARSESGEEEVVEEDDSEGSDIGDGNEDDGGGSGLGGGGGGGLSTVGLGGQGDQEQRTRGKVRMRGKPIRLDHSTVNKAACRILALDHARIVLGIGPRTVKILYLV
ncbi:hypothetical protein BGX33_000015 [Mortierella sp. NVP41]|nr:hypothetical protein BGX33_000015 [Mortierella sp. NVP41]